MYAPSVDEQEASERSERLLVNVERARDLLAGVGVTRWADWMDAVLRELLAHDAHGLDRLLSAFGGMGSINDFVITTMNGHRVEGAKMAAVNQEFGALRSDMYADASALRMALSREG